MLLELVLKTVFGRRDLRAIENNGIKIFAIASREIVELKELLRQDG